MSKLSNWAILERIVELLVAAGTLFVCRKPLHNDSVTPKTAGNAALNKSVMFSGSANG